MSVWLVQIWFILLVVFLLQIDFHFSDEYKQEFEKQQNMIIGTIIAEGDVTGEF